MTLPNKQLNQSPRNPRTSVQFDAATQMKQTRSSATTEKQRVSCAHIPG